MRKHLEGLKVGLGIMEVASVAQAAKKIDPKVVDATIGMLYEDHHIHVFNSVKEIIENLSDAEKFAYGSSSGGIDTTVAIQKHLLHPHQKQIESNAIAKSIATCGATASLNFIINNFIEVSNSLIVSENAWDAYQVMCNMDQVKLVEYSMFKDNKFNIENFLETCKKVYIKEECLNILLNDPCNNPTGYTLSREEWDQIIDGLKDYHNVNIILDTAYLAFSDNILEFKNTLLKLSQTNINTFVVFSASKTYGLYGVRAGGTTLITQDAKLADDFYNSIDYSARGMYGSVPKMGCSILQNVVNIDKYYEMHLSEVNKQREILQEKGHLFVKLAKENNIEILPYVEGFFVVIKTNSPQDLYHKMVKKGVHGVPLKCGYRIALCSINSEDIPVIVEKLASLND